MYVCAGESCNRGGHFSQRSTRFRCGAQSFRTTACDILLVFYAFCHVRRVYQARNSCTPLTPLRAALCGRRRAEASSFPHQASRGPIGSAAGSCAARGYHGNHGTMGMTKRRNEQSNAAQGQAAVTAYRGCGAVVGATICTQRAVINRPPQPAHPHPRCPPADSSRPQHGPGWQRQRQGLHQLLYGSCVRAHIVQLLGCHSQRRCVGAKLTASALTGWCQQGLWHEWRCPLPCCLQNAAC